MDVINLKFKSTELIGLGIMMTSRSLTSFFNKGVKKSGLTICQIYAMYAIREFKGLNISGIAKKLYIDRTTLTRSISGIKKYVSIKRIDSDARCCLPELTPEGYEFLEKWMPKVVDLEKGISLMIADNNSFIRFVDSFSAGFSAKSEPGNEMDPSTAISD